MDWSYPLRLQCGVRHYTWGKLGKDSLIAYLLHEDKSVPYAELWMGAHPSCPSEVLVEEGIRTLDSLIRDFPKEILGSEVIQAFGPVLPFLFKVLSVRTALSIQAHPDRCHAAVLHHKDPEHYPDQSDKPEAAVALTPTSLLMGFRALYDIRRTVDDVPELAALIGEDLCQGLCADLSAVSESVFIERVYRKIMTAEPEEASLRSLTLVRRLAEKTALSSEEKWILRLSPEYPDGDIGFFSFFLLNFVELHPGQGVFIGPNTPHAYLEGDMVECMANSDNVVRAGLTQKFRDVDTLLDMLCFEPGQAPLLSVQVGVSGVTHYKVPAREFFVECLEGDFQEQRISTGGRVSVLLCVEGAGAVETSSGVIGMSPGDVYLLPAAIGEFEFSAVDGKFFRAGVPGIGRG